MLGSIGTTVAFAAEAIMIFVNILSANLDLISLSFFRAAVSAHNQACNTVIAPTTLFLSVIEF
jgi:hypothetical protein